MSAKDQMPRGRIRSRKSFTRATTVLTDVVTDPYGNVTTVSNNPRVIELQNWASMSDVVTPGFAAKQARGELVNSPMSSVSQVYTIGGTGSSASYNDGGGWTEVYGNSDCTLMALLGPPVSPPHTFDVEKLVGYTQTNALAKCKTSSLMGLVTLAEMGKTMRMLTNPLESIRGLADFIYRERLAKKVLVVERKNGETRSINGRAVPTSQYGYRDRKYPGRAVRSSKETILIPISQALSSAVLCNNLGLRPLLMDIDAVLKKIPQAHQNDRLTFRSTSEENDSVVQRDSIGVGGMTSTYSVLTKHQVKVRCSIMIRDKFSVSEDFGVSLSDLPEAAWELIPYSFLFDYLVNVGEFLGALRAYTTQDILGASTVYTITSVTEREGLSAQKHLNWTIIKSPTGKDTVTSTTKVRVIGLSRPELQVKPVSTMGTPTQIQNVLSLTVRSLNRLRAADRGKTPFY